MKKLRVAKVVEYGLEFEGGVELFSFHRQDCCEKHYLSFSDLSLSDFEGLEFNLSNNKFFKRIKGYGIELRPIKGFPIRVPGYGENNGEYSSELELIVKSSTNAKVYREYDITDCQNWSKPNYIDLT